MVVELNCNLLENIYGDMVVLCGPTPLHRGIITIRGYFTGKILQSMIDLQKPQNFPP